ncbi:NADH dehydrogenase [ubiquinone] iron-sulfur protein 5 [Anolis carolinensis]|nr:PREDICTED: NADH dehydrogenase [ubiquinone] iron-sulfur protein 5 [Anolis carolinensis]|eukprot:XP_003227429.1 PREDICTED: NADH dehydrogenase [ubiquinone] iron-sulfur protein 5 [Anolis carolinensis]
MPVFDLQDQLGIDIDRWFLIQSGKQPFNRPSVCHAFEKEWLECSEGIGQTRAKKECRLEMEDLTECINMHKMIKRLVAISKQREKLMKEGKYTPPDFHSGKPETQP